MKKRITALLLVLVLGLFLALPAAAAPVVGDTYGLIDDGADLLTDEQEAKLTVYLESLGKKLDISLVVVTVDSLGGKSPRSYADDYYDTYGFLPDGALFLVSMEFRDWWVSTSGKCEDEISSDKIEDAVVSYLSSGSYYAAFEAFGKSCEEQMTPAYFLGAVICIAIGVVVALIVTFTMRSQMKSVRPQHSAASCICPGSLNITTSRDVYLYRTHTVTAKPKSSSSSGSHTSSSGRSHGGGGGKF